MTKFIFLLLFFPAVCSAQQNKLRKLYPLIGKWKMNSKNGVLYEEWKLINDSTFNGGSYVIKASGDTSFMESIELVSREGNCYYVPTVAKQNEGKPVIFNIITLTDSGFVASNPSHDFPQNIIYTFTSSVSLIAKVNGLVNGQMREESYSFIKQ